uniref:Uncharacterized protein n=1 Tax=Junco hyemalis TaxID=40217 RepID=A0A8C5NPL0_JUNHY
MFPDTWARLLPCGCWKHWLRGWVCFSPRPWIQWMGIGSGFTLPSARVMRQTNMQVCGKIAKAAFFPTGQNQLQRLQDCSALPSVPSKIPYQSCCSESPGLPPAAALITDDLPWQRQEQALWSTFQDSLPFPEGKGAACSSAVLLLLLTTVSPWPSPAVLR